MKKALKIIAWSLGGLIALVLVALLTLPLWIGPAVTGITGAVVPEYTGGPFKIESFALNPYTGKLRVKGLNLGNPQGFEDPTAVSFDTLSVDFDTCSLLTDKIHIRDITLETTFVAYVNDSDGVNNFERIAENAKKKMGPKEEEEEDKDKSKKKVVIDSLNINGTKVKFLKLTIPVPSLSFKDIGKDKPEGASFEDVMEAIWEKIKSVFSGIGGLVGGAANALGDAAKNVTEGASKILGEGAKNVTEGASKVLGEGASNIGKGASDLGKSAMDGVKDAGKAVSEGAKDAGKAVSEGAKDALKKVGNLFGK